MHSLLGAPGEQKSWRRRPRGRETAAVSSQPAPQTWNRPHGQVFKQKPRPSVGDVDDLVTERGLGLHALQGSFQWLLCEPVSGKAAMLCCWEGVSFCNAPFSQQVNSGRAVTIPKAKCTVMDHAGVCLL